MEKSGSLDMYPMVLVVIFPTMMTLATLANGPFAVRGEVCPMCAQPTPWPWWPDDRESYKHGGIKHLENLPS